jgi:hypothetical protein
MKTKPPRICYLCGDPIPRKERSRDHVPPLSFTPRAVRRSVKVNLKTLPTHGACNRDSSDDEEYFRATLSELANAKPTGKALRDDVVEGLSKPESKRLRARILGESTDRSLGGIILPRGYRHKMMDAGRVDRVLWKLVRGIHFLETETRLSPNCLRSFALINEMMDKSRRESLEALRRLVVNLPPRGQHPGLFSYKWSETQDVKGMCAGAMLFWDSVMFLFLYHLPSCPCGTCRGPRLAVEG